MRRKPVLSRRLRRGRSAQRSFLHLSVPRQITAEEAAQLKQQFLAASRSGIVVTSPDFTVTRIR